MEKIDNSELEQLTEAILLWTGWRKETMPLRDDSILVSRFGTRTAAKILSRIKSLEDDFYLSDARLIAPNLEEMERMSAEQFREKHPQIPEDIVKALAWCYTFDFK